jgi:hypothetical protein
MAAFLALAVCAQAAAGAAQSDADSADRRARKAERELAEMKKKCPCCGQYKPEYNYSYGGATARNYNGPMATAYLGPDFRPMGPLKDMRVDENDPYVQAHNAGTP